MKEFEEEMKNLELKYDGLLKDVFEKRRQRISQHQNELYSEYWLRVLTNHKLTKDFISDEDKSVLKILTDIRHEKLQDGNV